MLTEIHLRVLRLHSEAAAPYGFALGGGSALNVHAITDRPTLDIDSYVDRLDPDLFTAATATVRSHLERAGLEFELRHTDDFFRGGMVTDPTSGLSVGLDMGYDYRDHQPVTIEGMGTILDARDVVVGKVRALLRQWF